MFNIRRLAACLPIAILGFAAPAQAECLGPNCYSGLEALIGSVIVYGLLALTLLGLLIARKWRAVAIFAGLLFAIAICVPLVSQAVQAWHLSAMERREVVGTPPPLTSVTPLLVASKEDCYYGACEAIVKAAGPGGIIVLPLEVLEAQDMSAPLDLASLPLQNWASPREPGGSVDLRRLSPTMAAQIAPKIDYVILVQSTFYASTQSPFDRAMSGNPTLSGMRKTEIMRFATAPLPPGTGVLSLQSLQFDLLDLMLAEEALGLPLASLNTQSANNTNPTAAAAAQAICPLYDGNPEYDCIEGLR